MIIIFVDDDVISVDLPSGNHFRFATGRRGICRALNPPHYVLVILVDVPLQVVLCRQGLVAHVTSVVARHVLGLEEKVK